MPALLSFLASGALGGAALALEFRLEERRVEAMAWREADGAIAVRPDTLAALGVRAPAGESLIELGAIPGLSFYYDPAEAAVHLACDARCYPPTRLAAPPRAPPAPMPAAGGFLNVEAVGALEGREERIAGAVELGLFGAAGAGGVIWAASEKGIVRLETVWTVDAPAERLRLRLGDGIWAGAADEAGLRYGGVALGTDFSLDPAFAPYPSPLLTGEAATAATVDLYVQGALRARSEVAPGPFAIVDPPLVSGAGVAQVVVTDALGREQVIARPFYISPQLLRPGLTEFALAAGARREQYGLKSDDYGDGFVALRWRQGLTPALTAGISAEADAALINAGGGLTGAMTGLGEVDLGLAISHAEAAGVAGRAAWRRVGPATGFALGVDLRSPDYISLQDPKGTRRLHSYAQGSAQIGEAATAAFALTHETFRARPERRTAALSFAPRLSPIAQLQLSALHAEAETESTAVTLGLSIALGAAATASARTVLEEGAASVRASAQRPAERAGGFGWRVSGAAGEIERMEASATHLGRAHEASFEWGRAGDQFGVRAGGAAGLVWVDGLMAASRPVRGSFAVVDAGAPGVPVLRDRRAAGETDRRGRLALTDLRPYEPNLIGIDLDRLPLNVALQAPEQAVTPRARAGAAARFPIAAGLAGRIRIVAADGAPLPVGAVLAAAGGARFPIGSGGWVYVAGVADGATLEGPSCRIVLYQDDILSEATKTCAG